MLFVCVAALALAQEDPEVPSNMGLGFSPTGCQKTKHQRIQYLDRHAVGCFQSSALSAWKLGDFDCKRYRDMKFQQNCAAADLGSCSEEATTCAKARYENIQNLDRHHVDCGEGRVLTYWKFTNEGCADKDYLRFQYGCCAADVYERVEHFSRCHRINDRRLDLLDLFPISCPEGTYVSSWGITKDGCNSQFRLRMRHTCVNSTQPALAN